MVMNGSVGEGVDSRDEDGEAIEGVESSLSPEESACALNDGLGGVAAGIIGGNELHLNGGDKLALLCSGYSSGERGVPGGVRLIDEGATAISKYPRW